MLIVYINELALKGIYTHVIEYADKEAIGKLIGTPYYHRSSHCKFIDIQNHVPVNSISTAQSVEYSFEAFEILGKDLLINHEKEMVVGWYHSHPNLGCFLSKRDIRTQKENYTEWYHCALVIDHFSNEMEFFNINEFGEVQKLEYYIYRKRR